MHGLQGRRLRGDERRGGATGRRRGRYRGQPSVVAPVPLAPVDGPDVPAVARLPPVPSRLRPVSSPTASAQRQKIILPAVVCSTLVTLTSIVLPSARLA
jgi:hypothetical protein